MVKQGGGHIVNVSSAAGRRGLPFMAAYCASKFALTGLIESIRVELSAHNIAFTTVFPGGVETEMPNNLDRSKLPSGYKEHRGVRISAKRAARAIVCALRDRPLEVYVPWWMRYTARLSMHVPALTDLAIRIVHKDALTPP